LNNSHDLERLSKDVNIPLANYTSTIDRFSGILQIMFGRADSPPEDSTVLLSAGHAALLTNRILQAIILDEITQLLQERQSRLIRKQLLILVITLIIVGIAFGLGSLIMRQISVSLRQLIQASKRLAQGDWSARVKIIYSDEMGDVCRAFNDMVQSVLERTKLLGEEVEIRKKTEEELTHHRHHLEEIVSTRTHDLVEANEKLKKLVKELENTKEQADVARVSKQQFLANMSHELRTPLNTIIGYSYMLKEDALLANLGGFANDLSKIISSAEHLLELINEVLDISKIEAGNLQIFLEDIDVVDFAANIHDVIKPIIENQGNHFELDCPADIGIIHTDSTRLRQSILQLLNNANKYTKNGYINLKISRHSSSSPQNDWIHFQISDTGTGINSEQLTHLFEAFSPSEITTTRKFSGSKLGLFITKRICEMLNGRISVQSEANKGSTFTIILPAISKQGIEKSASIALPTQQNDKSIMTPQILETVNKPIQEKKNIEILIVDDDPIACELFKRGIKRAGWKVMDVVEGRKAINYLEKTERLPTLILLDLMMSEINGFWVLSVLQRHHKWNTIPVIVVTAKDLTYEERGILTASTKAVLSKGAYSQKELMAAIAGIIEK
jgi:signal transduction histidine kinase/CheY-like chemotaxis protein